MSTPLNNTKILESVEPAVSQGTKETTTGEVKTSNSSTLTFNEGIISHDIKYDKYVSEIREAFTFENIATNDKFRVPKDKLLEIANLIKGGKSVNYLIRNGWPASERMKAGCGIAVKINLNQTNYEFIFFTGTEGEFFDSNKVIKRSYIKVEASILDAYFTCLKYNEKIEKDKAEELMKQRTTLDLG